MAKAKVLVTRRIPEEGLGLLKGKVQLDLWEEDRVIPRSSLLKRVKGVEGLLPLLTDTIDGAVMDAAGEQLKVISNYAVGFNNIDVEAATKRGVMVTNTPGVLTASVSEHAIALLLATARRVAESDRFTRAGQYKGWAPLLLLGSELEGKTLGIVGLGRIGSRVAEIAVRGFGMKVLYCDPKKNRQFEKKLKAKFCKNLPTLLREADFVSLHVPLLPSTRHLIKAKELRLMKKTAYLVNTSRGPVVDEKALVKALKERWIAGAALDVFEREPKLAPGLARLDNVVLTPHTASATLETRGAMARLAAEGLLEALSGKTPKNLVNKEVLRTKKR
jgi:glyoxylate reductase